MKNIPQIALASSVSFAIPVALSASTVQNDHCKMSYAQAFAPSEYQIRYFNTVGVTEATASKAKAAIHACRILKEQNETSNLQGVCNDV